MSNLIKDIPKEERKLLRKTFWRSFTLYSAVSPAKQGGSGFCYSMMPFINKFYSDPKDRKEALVRHMSYFSATIPLSTFIMGLTASMEKENSIRDDFDTTSINAVKSSLMGPLSGIGDSIFWGVLRVIAAGVAVSMGQSGNVLAPIIFLLLFNVPAIIIKYYGTFLGYSLGSKYIERLYTSGLINILTKAASIVGLIMVGGMTSQMVIFKTTVQFKMGGTSVLNLQKMLDQIFVGIIPLGITLICFYLLKNKKVSVNALLIGVIILGILLSALGIA
ncbi:PTS system mannose/fructose/sorbose family transporter subunit IID [Clostridium tyrobutyricum]|uniref:PTS system mannose/fructose/sorbose family transporter subunit IID n=1 Tax=Clostridium tyrobutyricum TaxID=1519 RepID=UPI001C386D16|nr:PTS system mannose/fructose/sorbose family transporter subunit IID [Clostridium tyrobutyricum]MBV4439782.1 PTS system mannose/fructose/sorbose family transporter subunit IID [Clostridium tyrobutyricum]